MYYMFHEGIYIHVYYDNLASEYMCWICIFMRGILPNHSVWVPYISSATVIIGSHVQKQLWSTCTIYFSDNEW